MAHDHSVLQYFPMGPTKEGERLRTIQMLLNITHAEKRDLMYALYLMADSSYNNEDLRAMAKLLEDDIKRRERLTGKLNGTRR